ncbi:MAG: CAP domain-containing protein [Clostridium sp.]|uniref:CAP domain-containing protein n=1 Tax=Clostridium sp. TaxID=1506 RepID=UPI0030276046
MKKQFITLMICGALASTALVGVTIQNGEEWAKNIDKILSDESENLENKTGLTEETTSNETDLTKEKDENKQGNNEGKENEVVVDEKSGHAPSEDTSSGNATGYGLESYDREIVSNNDNLTEDVPETNKPSTPTEKPSAPIIPSVTTPNNGGDFSSQVEQLIFNKVNQERSKAGVPQLSYSGLMEKYARIKSKDMGDRNYFDHKNPEGQLITTKMDNDGVTYRAWGENIAYIGGVSDLNALADQFMTNWMNSQGHRENILSTNFESIGVGVYKSGNKYYATQEFYK